MVYSDIKLSTDQGIRLELSNSFDNLFDLTDAIEDSKDSNDLLERLKKIKSYIKTFSIDRETEKYVRYKLICNMCNNIEYLIIYK